MLLKYQGQINRLVVALLVIFLLAYLAELTWRVWPQGELAQSALPVTSVTPITSGGNSNLDLLPVKRLNLFGDFQAAPVTEQTVTDAPETKLNLTLTGVVASSVEAQGAAIIENRGSQETYGLGDKIIGTNATLREVFRDRVIIRNGVINETLMLDGIDFDEANKKRARASRRPAPEMAPSPTQDNVITLSDDVIDATRMLQQQPANFTDFISVAPHSENGELQGYRVSPGKKPELFKAAGLLSGDVITDINGLNLTDPQQAVEAMGELRAAQSLQITVSRNDELLTLFLDLPDAEQE
ncbi:Type II secretion system protein C [Paraglaciecola mesophila]|uniref:Type II secretion system protein C n=1 Tax=Paraglaciecola mesophila TaxID=197222 RepID=A0A857JMN0_9ALTE|nr:type II secretion system protein GspC [Paraglaciecola mesophila]QHJ12227.1 Type II secretion system protein C [Paraglaciecola mesophila]